MLNIPEAIILDIDNTIYEYMPCHIYAMSIVSKELEIKHKVSKKNFTLAYNKSRKIIKSRLLNTASSHSRILYFQNTIEILFKKTDIILSLYLEEIYWKAFINKAKLFDGVIKFLKFLKLKKIKIAVLTDLTTQIQFKKLIHFKINNYFDYVVTSEESGIDKPNKTPFNLIIKKLNINPRKIWMIGDNPHKDMTGAGNVKLNKIQKKHGRISIVKNGKGKPDLVFN
ncbi:HAD family hydrolase, partial [Pelagibacteraceae bacterium]|nr:HAD family hydrolase [Pelagibacteraceae bacterium]